MKHKHKRKPLKGQSHYIYKVIPWNYSIGLRQDRRRSLFKNFSEPITRMDAQECRSI
jgi:predicted transcriptional regulator